MGESESDLQHRLKGRLILVHLTCDDMTMAPFQTEIVEENEATGILHLLLLVEFNACTNQIGKKGVTI